MKNNDCRPRTTRNLNMTSATSDWTPTSAHNRSPRVRRYHSATSSSLTNRTIKHPRKTHPRPYRYCTYRAGRHLSKIDKDDIWAKSTKITVHWNINEQCRINMFVPVDRVTPIPKIFGRLQHCIVFRHCTKKILLPLGQFSRSIVGSKFRFFVIPLHFKPINTSADFIYNVWMRYNVWRIHKKHRSRGYQSIVLFIIYRSFIQLLLYFKPLKRYFIIIITVDVHFMLV